LLSEKLGQIDLSRLVCPFLFFTQRRKEMREKNMKSEDSSIQVMAIYQATFLDYQGIPPDLIKQGTRVIFLFPNIQSVLEQIQDYNRNPSIPILDFVHCLRKLRSQMLATR